VPGRERLRAARPLCSDVPTIAPAGAPVEPFATPSVPAPPWALPEIGTPASSSGGESPATLPPAHPAGSPRPLLAACCSDRIGCEHPEPRPGNKPTTTSDDTKRDRHHQYEHQRHQRKSVSKCLPVRRGSLAGVEMSHSKPSRKPASEQHKHGDPAEPRGSHKRSRRRSRKRACRRSRRRSSPTAAPGGCKPSAGERSVAWSVV